MYRSLICIVGVASAIQIQEPSIKELISNVIHAQTEVTDTENPLTSAAVATTTSKKDCEGVKKAA